MLEKEKKQLKDRANSLEAQVVLKGRAVKEVEGVIEQVEQKHKEVGTIHFTSCTCICIPRKNDLLRQVCITYIRTCTFLNSVSVQ